MHRDGAHVYATGSHMQLVRTHHHLPVQGCGRVVRCAVSVGVVEVSRTKMSVADV